MAEAKKTILLANDTSVSLPLSRLVAGLNSRCKALQFSSYPEQIDLGDSPISNPATYDSINHITKALLGDHSALLIATNLEYDNNFFYDGELPVVIISFSGWTYLTDLARTNGLVGFIVGILADELQLNEVRHEDNTGCINDFLMDKSGIDMRLRAGTLCRECRARAPKSLNNDSARKLGTLGCTVKEGYEDMMQLLEDVSSASKRDQDILEYWETKVEPASDFDVFLCHNSDDKPSVRLLYRQLTANGIRPWFDEEHLKPGLPWQDELEATIPKIRNVAVIVGPNGQGPWQDIELRAFLTEFGNRKCGIIPVILADAPAVPVLPLFLRQFTWVDFRKTSPSPLNKLLWGITGIKPVS